MMPHSKTRGESAARLIVAWLLRQDWFVLASGAFLRIWLRQFDDRLGRGHGIGVIGMMMLSLGILVLLIIFFHMHFMLLIFQLVLVFR